MKKYIILMILVLSTFLCIIISKANNLYSYDADTKTFNLSETTVFADVKVKETGTDESSYKDSITVSSTSSQRAYDFKATIDMSPVQERVDATIEILKTKGSYDEFKDRIIKGKFVVTINPGLCITLPESDVNGTDMYGFATDSSIYQEISREIHDNNLIITIGLKDDVTIERLKDANSLSDISYVINNVPVATKGIAKIKGTVNGYVETVDLPGTDDYNAKGTFVAKEDGNEEISVTIKSVSSGVAENEAPFDITQIGDGTVLIQGNAGSADMLVGFWVFKAGYTLEDLLEMKNNGDETYLDILVTDYQVTTDSDGDYEYMFDMEERSSGEYMVYVSLEDGTEYEPVSFTYGNL